MYKNEFDNCLKQNKIFKSYMFYGQSSYLVERYILKSMILNILKIDLCNHHFFHLQILF